MKTERLLTPQYSGYPLRIVEETSPLHPVKLEVAAKNERWKAAYQFAVHPMANDPVNWDVAWFASYE